MKYIIRNILIYLILFTSCVNHKRPEVNNIDSCKTVLTDSEKIRLKAPDTLLMTKDSLIKFLENPFDLHKYKMVKRGANSGSAKIKDYYFKPDYEGFYYRYFLFPVKYSDTVSNTMKQKCYLDGVSVNVYKKNGVMQKKYSDSTEVLIDFTTSGNDNDLPEMNFIQMDSTILFERFGMPLFTRDTILIYSHLNKAIIFKMNGRMVGKMRYVVLNYNLTKGNDDDDLYNF